MSGLAGPHLARLVLLEESVELADAGRVAHLAERLGLDLADSLAGHTEFAPDFFKRTAPTVFQPEAELQHPSFPLTDRAEYVVDLLLQ